MAETVEVHVSDLEKVLDAAQETVKFLKLRDEMNASVHLAKEVRYSPLTNRLGAEVDRLYDMIGSPV